MSVQRLRVMTEVFAVVALNFFGLLLNSQIALKSLARHYARQGMDEQAAADLVAGQRAQVKRRAITASCALIAIGVVLNGSRHRPAIHDIASLLIYVGLFVLTTQIHRGWFLNPADLKDYLLRRR